MKRIFSLIFLVLIVFFPNALFASGKKKVLIICSYHRGYKWSDGEIEGIEKIFSSMEDQVELSVEYMDTKRIKTPEFEKIYLDLLQLKFEQYKPDLIIVLDDNAFQFILKYCRVIFHCKIPVVFAGVNDFSPSMIEENRDLITGIVQGVDLEDNLKLAKELRPEAKTVVIILDESTSGRIYEKSLRALESKIKDFKFEYINTSRLTYDEMIQAIQKQPDSSIGLLLAYTKNKDRYFVRTKIGYEAITQTANFPFLGVMDMSVKSGAMGGKVQDSIQHGMEAANIAMEILDGKSPGDIPVRYESRMTHLFNYNQLRRFNISKSQLPPGSIVINEPESFYYKYRREVWIVISIFIFLIGSIIILSINISRRKAVEGELLDYQNHLEEIVDSRTVELKNANQTLTETLEKLTKTRLQLVEAEKMAALGNLVAGIAHQINTPAGIGITAASHLEATINHYNDLCKDRGLKIDDVKELMSITGESSSLIMGNLKRISRIIDTFKLTAAENNIESTGGTDLKQLIVEIILNPGYEYDREKYKIALKCDEDLEIKSYVSVYKEIFTNLIVNALKHGFKDSGEGLITIDVTTDENNLFINFADDGRGIGHADLKHIFEPFYNISGKSGGTGLGLHIVYNLVVNTLKGAITYRSSEGKGCEFLIAIPLSHVSLFGNSR